ncbi:MAG: 23S rRNA (uracil(1939)-C(5))-methyltransferase [Betaproteobacteria bacterium RIFCSPLOWO2_02_FULL_67_19]|nr:MAG: 23S rRNA (uracil(1939)-C(5))-methyltransferase [Betaproteobacteria bacterium RIFCSPLOWO2_02_FULL_67_19]
MTLAVVALDAEGRGVARNPDGKVVFVEGALAGEIVAARLVRSQRSFDLMRATTVLQESSGRRAPRCAYFGVCGGCATQHADARTQVAAKQRWLEDCLQRIGKVEPGCILAPIHGEEWGYRRRARLSVRYLAKQGVAMVGFRERRSTFVADMDSCEVLPPRVAALIPGLRRLVASLSIRDRLPQIEVAVGDEAVALVFRHLLPLSAEDEARLREFAQQTGIRVWLQPGGPDSAHPFAPESGPALHYTLPEFGVRIEFRPTDFTQVNHGVNRLLVARAVRLLDPQPGERIADLFCGLGNFALPMARCGAQVTGFEGSAGLVERARQNAALNGLTVRFESADLARHGIGSLGPFDKLLLDPPREGAVELIKALPPDWPRRIVYVSCDPATLARDASVLVHTKGFALGAAGVVNMFPHTAHVESIALFER